MQCRVAATAILLIIRPNISGLVFNDNVTRTFQVVAENKAVQYSTTEQTHPRLWLAGARSGAREAGIERSAVSLPADSSFFDAYDITGAAVV